MPRSRLFQAMQAKVAYLGTCLLLVGCGFVLAAVARADTPEFPTEPILRLNPEAYTAPIRSISVDEQGGFIATGSDDETVRVWDLETGRLEQVLRVPLGGPESQSEVRALALSPNARQVAVSTKVYSFSYSIYVFDRRSGGLQYPAIALTSLSGTSLTYSPDGRYLAVLAGSLHVYETRRYGMIGEDLDGIPLWADFDTENRLVTTGYPDIRLYAAGEYSKPYIRRPNPPGKRTFGGIFSPDGQSIVVSYSDSTRIDVLSAKTLARVYSPNTKPMGIGRLSGAGWSPDGRYLFAGSYSKSGPNAVIRWSQAGRGGIIKYPLESEAYIGSRPLADGRLVVIGGKGSLLALLDADGKERWVRRSEWPNFRDQDGRDGPGIALARTGDIVEFGFQRFGKQRARFELKPPRLKLEPPADASLQGPLLTAPGLTVTGWNDMPRADLNGDPLGTAGTSRALAIAPDHQLFVVAGDTVEVFDARSGRRLDSPDIPGVTWAGQHHARWAQGGGGHG